MDKSFDIDKVIEKLLESKDEPLKKDVNLTENEISQLCLMSREIFLNQAMLLDLKAPIKVCGDIHG